MKKKKKVLNVTTSSVNKICQGFRYSNSAIITIRLTDLIQQNQNSHWWLLTISLFLILFYKLLYFGSFFDCFICLGYLLGQNESLWTSHHQHVLHVLSLDVFSSVCQKVTETPNLPGHTIDHHLMCFNAKSDSSSALKTGKMQLNKKHIIILCLPGSLAFPVRCHWGYSPCFNTKKEYYIYK